MNFGPLPLEAIEAATGVVLPSRFAAFPCTRRRHVRRRRPDLFASLLEELPGVVTAPDLIRPTPEHGESSFELIRLDGSGDVLAAVRLIKGRPVIVSAYPLRPRNLRWRMAARPGLTG